MPGAAIRTSASTSRDGPHMAPPFSFKSLDDPPHRLLRGMLSSEGRPFVVPVVQGIPGMTKIGFCLAQPVTVSVGDG